MLFLRNTKWSNWEARRDISRKCAENVRNLRVKRVRSVAAPKEAATVVRNTVVTRHAIAVGNLDTEDLIVLIATKDVVVVMNVVT